MNIIDRSPMKSSTQEALLAQSTRRMIEARTDEEKSYVVQNFAEQIRLEKLRAKRLQENMREFNQAITSGGGASAFASSSTSSSLINNNRLPQPPPGSSIFVVSSLSNQSQNNYYSSGGGATATNSTSGGHGSRSSSSISRIGGSMLVRQDNRSLPFGTNTQQQFEMFRDDAPKHTYFATDGGGNGKGGGATTPSSSHSLNVHARPFNPLPHIGQSASLIQETNRAAMQEAYLRRNTGTCLSMPPPAHVTSPIAAAVAPKASAVLDWNQQQAAIVNGEFPTDGRSRSTSIGSSMNFAPALQRIMSLSAAKVTKTATSGDGGMGRGDAAVYFQQQQQRKSISPTFGGQGAAAAAPFSQLKIDSDLPSMFSPSMFNNYLQQQAVEGGAKPRPPTGSSIKIDNSAATFAGFTVLNTEDWDAEYADDTDDAKRQMPSPTGALKPAGFIGPMKKSANKDWVSILKEREDMANRRYSRDMMVRLLESEICKIRPPELAKEYYNEAGLWNPDSWFFINFQKDQPQTVNRKPNYVRLSADSAPPSQNKSAAIVLRRVDCLSDLEKQQQQQQPMATMERRKTTE